MKLLNEYLERAVSLEKLAAGEQDSTFKTQLLNQAAVKRHPELPPLRHEELPPPSRL
jgi:hypothetical protein